MMNSGSAEPTRQHDTATSDTNKKQPCCGYETMGISQLKALCRERGIDTRTFVEKKELVEALQKEEADEEAAGALPNDNIITLLPGVKLTKEQRAIVDTCRPPVDYHDYLFQNPTTIPEAQPQGDAARLIRITAAAGTGKTTTLLCLALRAAQLQHRHITYLTFTKAAAQDGRVRLLEAMHQQEHSDSVNIDARTLHSAATRALNVYRIQRNSNADVSQKVWSDKQVKAWIATTLHNEIEDFLQPCYEELQRRYGDDRKLQSRQRQAKDQVEFFLYKTLNQFCTKAMTVEQFETRATFGRDYYPAVLFHTTEGKGEAKGEVMGFLGRVYNKYKVQWYAEQACKLWKDAEAQDLRTFSFIMKRAQLLGLPVPGSILLVDESQDMDECQVEWVVRQKEQYGKHVYVVGDAAQSIYSFRGAKPEFLMSIDADEDKFLTESWRFGPAVVNIANLVLFAKEYSDQTAHKWDHRTKEMRLKSWKPYRVKAGNVHKQAWITTQPLLHDWQSYRQRGENLTLIASYNKTLFIEVLGLFDIGSTKKSKGEDCDDAGDTVEEKAESDLEMLDSDNDEITDDSVRKHSIPNTAPSTLSFPKIHLNGFGENSGRRAWLMMFKVVADIFDLYMRSAAKESSDDDVDDDSNSNPSHPDKDVAVYLPEQAFPHFIGRKVTWTEFCDEVTNRELAQYSKAVSVVRHFKENTMYAVQLFQTEVVDKNYSSEDADIILTTCHSAKGMEWDHVVVANDFNTLANYAVDEDETEKMKKKNKSESKFESASEQLKRQKTMQHWKFGFDERDGDGLNLLYVACTRAKKSLSLPECVCNVMTDFDCIIAWNNSHGISPESQNTLTEDELPELPDIHGLEKVTSEALREIEDSLIRKYHAEVSIQDGQTITEYLIG